MITCNCPFCNGLDVGVEVGDVKTWVECYDCGAREPFTNRHYPDAESRAEKHWDTRPDNRRPTPPKP